VIDGARALRPMQMPAHIFATRDLSCPGAPACIITMAVAVHLLVSSNLLLAWGIDYASPGGNPLAKFHPGTYLAGLALLVYCAPAARPARRLRALLRRQPATGWMLGAFMLCGVYYVLALGPSGLATLVESYVAAGMLALLAAQLTPLQARRLGWVMLACLTIAAPLAIAETLLQWHLVPVYLGSERFVESPQDWRAAALYDHPLTGAMMMEIAILLLLAARVPSWIKAAGIALFLTAQVAFGGRTALLVTLLVLAGLGAAAVLRGLLTRRLQAGMAASVLAGAVVLPVALSVLVTQTSIGSRIAQHAYADESADERLLVWTIPAMMSPRQVLFGTSAPQQTELMQRLGFGSPYNDIENFWLLSFINLGLFGFVIYLAGLLPFLAGLWRQANVMGRLALVSTMTIATTSNSLARKSDILFTLVAAIFAMRGFAEPEMAA
jgi:hypothetical protein